MNMKPRLCLVEDDPLMGESLCERFELEGFHCDWLRDASSARERLLTSPYAAVVCDVCLPGVSGEALFRELSGQTEFLPPWLFITGHGTLPCAVEMMKLGAVDYIAKPFELDKLIAKLRDLCRLLPGPDIPLHSSLGIAPASRRLQVLLPRLAAQARVILLTGESGVGKEVIAREIHRLDPATADQPFIAVNCGALSDNLLESELFGHEKGAFTGAIRSHKGVFEQATGGTLLLDEIGDMPMVMQVKLLRAIQDRHIVRVGGERAITVEQRIICATHHDLKKLVRQGRFRDDLYYRIDLVHLRVPPLRERKEDILWLAQRFLAEFAARPGIGPKRLSPAAESFLHTHAWPGNIRQLRHAVERACLMSSSPVLWPMDLTEELEDRSDANTISPELGSYMQDCERSYIKAQLLAHGWNCSRTAISLGISRKNLWEKMRKLGIDGKHSLSSLPEMLSSDSYNAAQAVPD
jgi:DNA-binding NtrC family response regulator